MTSEEVTAKAEKATQEIAKILQGLEQETGGKVDSIVLKKFNSGRCDLQLNFIRTVNHSVELKAKNKGAGGGMKPDAS